MSIFLPSYPRGYRGTSYPRKTWPKKAATVSFMFNAEDVWAAAAAATRINDGYLKEPKFRSVIDSQGYEGLAQTHEANKVLVRKLLDANQGWTEEDTARGATARAYWQAQLMKMVGNTANDFEKVAVAAANKETIEGNYDLAVIASLVASAERGIARDTINDVKSNIDSKHQGKVGDHTVLTNAEVVVCGALSDFGKYRVDAKCEGNLYTWWSSKAYTAGNWVSVKGKVKGHTVDRGTNVAVTQLNYVKEI